MTQLAPPKRRRWSEETNIDHPIDSGLLGDGVRVITRTVEKIG